MASPTPTPTSTTPSFDPRLQTFTILNALASPTALSLPTLDAQRVRLANTSINYGAQLGLVLSSLLSTLLLLPSRRLRRPVHLAQALCLCVSAARLALLVLYFPGPLTEYYVAWTRDASVLSAAADYGLTTAAAALSVLQLALVEAALALQSRVLVRTWGAFGSNAPITTTAGTKIGGGGRWRRWTRNSWWWWWQPPVLVFAVVLAVATVAMRAVWVARYTQALRGHTLPVPLDATGQASVILGAASVFYFCGLFFAHLAIHLAATRRVLRGGRGGEGGRKFSVALTLKEGVDGRGGGGGRKRGGLTSLEILAVGNGILMLAPCLFAGLDVAAGPGNTRVLPFDAGSWVQTLVAAGLPLISIAAFYRGSDSADSRLNSRLGRFATSRPPVERRRTRNRNFHHQRRSSEPFSFHQGEIERDLFKGVELVDRVDQIDMRHLEDIEATAGTTTGVDHGHGVNRDSEEGKGNSFRIPREFTVTIDAETSRSEQ